MFEEHLQRRVLALGLRAEQLARNGRFLERSITEEVRQPNRIFTRVEHAAVGQTGTRQQRGLAIALPRMVRRVVIESSGRQQRGVIAVVVDGLLQVAVNGAHTQREIIRELLLEAQDVFILEHRLQVCRRDRRRVLGLAVFTVQIEEVPARHEASRLARGRVHARERKRFAAEQRGGGTADGNRRRQRQRVTTGVTEHLERGIAEHIPAEAQPRAELVLDLDVGGPIAIDVLEGIPTTADVSDEVIGDVPAIFDVERLLLDLDRRALAEVLLLHDVLPRSRARRSAQRLIGPLVTAFQGGTGHGLVVVTVISEPNQMAAQLPLGVDAELITRVAGIDTIERATADVALARIRASQLLLCVKTGVDDDRATLLSRGGNVAVVGSLAAVRTDEVSGTREFAMTVERRQSEGISQVAGVLEDIVVAALSVDGLADIRGAIQHPTGIQIGIHVVLLFVREPRELQDVVVGNVPIHLQQPLRILVLRVGIGGGQRGTPRVIGGARVRNQAIGKELVLDKRTAGPDVGSRVPTAVLGVVRTELAEIGRRQRIGVISVFAGFGETLRRVVDVATRLELVRTTLGDLVDHAAERATKFGAVTTGLHLLLGNRLERHLREVQVTERIRDVETVDVVLVFRDRGATERSEIAEGSIAADGTGREKRDSSGILRHRDRLDLLRRQHGGRFHRRDIDGINGASPDDSHRIQSRGVTCGEVDIRRTANLHHDITRRTAVAADLVLAGRQLREAVAAIRAHRDRAAEAGRRVADGDGVARGRATGHRACGIRLGLHATHERQTECNGQRATLQAFGNVIGSHCV